MSLRTSVRLATAEDAPQAAEWMLSTPLNLFDPEIANYPSLRTLAVDIDGSPELYVPFHPVLVVESLAHAPNVNHRRNAYALLQAQKSLDNIARSYGMSEIYWMCQDQSLINLAVRHGDYRPVNSQVLRKKVTL